MIPRFVIWLYVAGAFAGHSIGMCIEKLMHCDEMAGISLGLLSLSASFASFGVYLVYRNRAKS